MIVIPLIFKSLTKAHRKILIRFLEIQGIRNKFMNNIRIEDNHPKIGTLMFNNHKKLL